MDINIAPAMKIAFMGGVGYLCGQCTRIDPKFTAITFIIAEITSQIFSYLNEHYDWGCSDAIINGTCAAVSITSNRSQQTSYPFFTLVTLGVAFGVSTIIFDELKVKAQITIG